MDSVERHVWLSSAKLPCDSYPNTQSWSEQIHQSQGDCLTVDYVSSLLEEPYTSLTQNYLPDLATLWELFDISEKKKIYETYGDIVSII